MMRTLGMISLLALCACQTSWQRYPMSLYAALKAETPEAISAHHALLGDLYDTSLARGRKPKAGIAAEYAYYSWMLGMPALAQQALAVERASYPESAKFCALLERYAEGITPMEGATATEGGVQ